MRSLISAILAAALAVLAPALAASQAISISPDNWDFGRMKQNESQTITVMVENKGAGRLIVESVKADCGCTVPDLKVKELGPGESTPMTIEFNSKKFVGNVMKTVQVTSNDPTNPVADVILSANVWTPLAIDPASQRLGFPRSKVGEELTREATFEASDIPNLKISADRTKQGLFAVAVRNGVDGNPRKSVLTVTLPADMPVGQQRDNVRITTNVPEMPTVDFELKCWVNAPLYSSPDRVNFRYKEEFKQVIQVRATDQAIAFNVKKVRCDLPEIQVSFRVGVEGIETAIDVSGRPLTKDDPRAIKAEGRIQGTIFVETDAKEMPVLEIPVTYMIRM